MATKTKLDLFMSEIKAYDYKWFDEIGGNEALYEINSLREQVRNLTQRAAELAVCTCEKPMPDPFGNQCLRCLHPISPIR